MAGTSCGKSARATSARGPDGTFDPAKFAETAADPQIKMVELKLSQGAKPGHGGVLPAAKVTEEISLIRGVPMGQGLQSRPRTIRRFPRRSAF
jgi:hypothetical protein